MIGSILTFENTLVAFETKLLESNVAFSCFLFKNPPNGESSLVCFLGIYKIQNPESCLIG